MTIWSCLAGVLETLDVLQEIKYFFLKSAFLLSLDLVDVGCKTHDILSCLAGGARIHLRFAKRHVILPKYLRYLSCIQINRTVLYRT